MDSPAVYPRMLSTTLTSRTPQENHIVSVPFQTIEKNKKNVISLFFVSPGHLGTIQNLIPGCMTIVKLIKQVKNWQSPSRDAWSNCLINSRETTQRSNQLLFRPAKKTIPRQFADAQGKSWFCAGSRNQGRTAREGNNNRDIQIRD